MKQYKVIIIYAIFDGKLKKTLESELEKYGLERVGEQDIFCPSLRGIPDKGTGIQSLPAGLCTQASGQPRHGTVRGVTHERGTDSDNHAANQSDE